MYDFEDYNFLEKYLDQPTACCNCSSYNLIDYARQGFLSAKKCSYCGLISVNPYLTEEGVKLFYEKYFSQRISDEPELFEKRKDQYIVDRDFLLQYRDSGSILDIGSSGGYFLSTFDDEWEKTGFDLTHDAAETAMTEFGITVEIGEIDNYQFSRKFDVVSMRGVIEHFKNPNQIINKLPNLLNDGGLFYISATPNGSCQAFDLYRGDWKLFTPLEHVHFFSIPILSQMLGNKFTLIDEFFPYLETPYADLDEDLYAFKQALKQNYQGNKIDTESRAFPGSMMNGIWQFKEK